MMLFLHNLPQEATREHLADFVETRIHAHPLVRLLHHPRLADVKILRIRKPGGAVEYHGLIRVTPRHAASSLADLIDGVPFRGRPLAVRPYAERTQHDRRIAYTDPRLLAFPDRRMADRRRDALEISVVERTGPAGEGASPAFGANGPLNPASQPRQPSRES